MIIFLREKFIAQLFMWVIAIVFLVGTVLLYNNSQGGSGGPETEVVLRLGDAEVTRGDFERAVADAMRSARNQRFGGEPDREETQKSVIEQWIQQTILSSATVSDAEVERYIRSDANRVGLYNRYLQNGWEELYTQNVRLQLSATALRDTIQNLELVTDTEVEQDFRLEADKAKLKFIEFRHADYTAVIEVDDAEAEEHFEANRDTYKAEEQVNVKFIKVTPADYVTESDVQAYYDENPREFTTVEAVRARHILKKFPDNATDKQKAEVKTAAEELLKTVNEELAKGAAFAELAEKHSEGPSASQGGALTGSNANLPPGAYFARGDMVKPFEEACFDTLNPGEVSELVETQFGYHIITLEEKKPPETKPFDQVQYDIQQKLVKIRGTEEARRVATDLLYEVEITDYDTALTLDAYQEKALSVNETGLFRSDDATIPEIGPTWSHRGLIEALFDMEVGVIKVVEGKKTNGEVEAFFIATVLEKKPAAIPPFAEIKATVIEDVRLEKAKERALADAQTLVNQHTADESLDALLKKYQPPEGLTTERLSVQESSLFARAANSDYIGGMGNSEEAMFAAFLMKVDEVRGPLKGDSAAYIVQLVERQAPDLETFKTDTDEQARHRQALIQVKKRDAYLNWFAARKKQSNPWIHADYR